MRRLFCVVLLFGASLASAKSMSFEFKSLKGIAPSMRVFVETLPDDCPPSLTKKALKKDAEQKIRDAGISLDSHPLRPYFYVTLTCFRAGGGFVGVARISFNQRVENEWGEWSGHAATWNTGGAWSAPTDGAAEYLRGMFNNYVDEFLDDYRKANPELR